MLYTNKNIQKSARTQLWLQTEKPAYTGEGSRQKLPYSSLHIYIDSVFNSDRVLGLLILQIKRRKCK